MTLVYSGKCDLFGYHLMSSLLRVFRISLLCDVFVCYLRINSYLGVKSMDLAIIKELWFPLPSHSTLDFHIEI